jgi:hypothetical protein
MTSPRRSSRTAINGRQRDDAGSTAAAGGRRDAHTRGWVRTWRVFQRRLPISASDLAILRCEHDRYAVERGPYGTWTRLLFTEQTCVPFWGYCGTVPMVFASRRPNVIRMLITPNVRDATRPIPDAWDDAITV